MSPLGALSLPRIAALAGRGCGATLVRSSDLGHAGSGLCTTGLSPSAEKMREELPSLHIPFFSSL